MQKLISLANGFWQIGHHILVHGDRIKFSDGEHVVAGYIEYDGRRYIVRTGH